MFIEPLMLALFGAIIVSLVGASVVSLMGWRASLRREQVTYERLRTTMTWNAYVNTTPKLDAEDLVL